jgi:hypothetical protein
MHLSRLHQTFPAFHCSEGFFDELVRRFGRPSLWASVALGVRRFGRPSLWASVALGIFTILLSDSEIVSYLTLPFDCKFFWERNLLRFSIAAADFSRPEKTEDIRNLTFGVGASLIKRKTVPKRSEG